MDKLNLRESRSESWRRLTDLLENYLEENKNPETPVVNYKSAKDLKAILDLSLSEEGVDSSKLFEVIKEYLQYSPRTTHPQFNNQLYGGFHFEALMGEVVSFIANTSLSTYEISPAATLIEEKLISEINGRIGFTSGSGIMCTGGSNANLLAVHCARARMFPEAKYVGNPKEDVCIFVSKSAHYSFQKSVNLMGLGMDNIVSVPVDEQGRMIPHELDLLILKSKAEGKIPMMVASTAGTTVLGAFDFIEENDHVAKKHKLWHHVDGAWGGAVMFSQSHSHKLKGLEQADSFTFDAHKMMATGLITSFFCTKDKNILREANSGGGSSYLFHEYENSEFDTGAYSLQCGRKVDSLKFWLVWKSLGNKGLERHVDAQYEKRDYFMSLVEAHPRLKMIHRPEHLNVCFQVIPESESVDINRYNFNLRYKLVKRGRIMTNFSSHDDGTIFFRHVFANNQTTFEDLDRLVYELTDVEPVSEKVLEAGIKTIEEFLS